MDDYGIFDDYDYDWDANIHVDPNVDCNDSVARDPQDEPVIEITLDTDPNAPPTDDQEAEDSGAEADVSRASSGPEAEDSDLDDLGQSPHSGKNHPHPAPNTDEIPPLPTDVIQRKGRKKKNEDILEKRLKEKEKRDKLKKSPKRGGGYERMDLQFKLAILDELHASGKPLLVIAAKFGLSEGTVRGWKRNEKHMRGEVSKGRDPAVKSIKNSNFPKLDEAFLIWFAEKRRQKAVLTGEVLAEAANM